ncbi:MAG TPA: hypothetical protein VGO58_01985 [Chitinophagaceae bacterium]|jgi:hypothetical protein|nr:hypothetical protein [Chitinophagaceae bacterium]
MIKKTSIAIFFCLASYGLTAQKQFVIYSVAGDVSVKSNNDKSLAIAGKLVPAKTMFHVGQGGGITLICEKGFMISIADTGNYVTDEIHIDCAVPATGITTNFALYLRTCAEKPSDRSGNMRKMYMNTIGAVTGLREPWVNRMFDTLNYTSTADLPLSWKSYRSTQFEFELYRPGNTATPFFHVTLNKDHILLSDLAQNIKQGETFYWNVRSPDGESGFQIINYVGPETYDEFLVKLISQQPGIEAPAQQAFRFAFMLENAHYLAEAYPYYLKAAILDPMNILYRLALTAFKKDYEIK